MSEKAKILPFTGDWHLELADSNKAEAKAVKALRTSEMKEAARMLPRPRRTPAPAIGWSDPKEQLFTVEELAKHWKVTPSSIYKAVRLGELIAEPFGNALRFSRAQIDAYKTRQHLKRHG